MKTLTLLIFGFLLFPMSLSAQSVDVLLQKVSEALSAGKDDYAVSLFRQAAGAGTEQTEIGFGKHPFIGGFVRVVIVQATIGWIPAVHGIACGFNRRFVG